MSMGKVTLSLCFSLFIVCAVFETGTLAADVETVGDLKVHGVVESTSGGFKFPDGITQTSACNACVNGVLSITLGGTGENNATDARTNLAVPGLATPNTFTGTQTIFTGAAGNNGLVVQGFLGQTADLQQWKQSHGLSSYVVASVGSDGDIATSGNVSATGQIESTSGGFKFPDATVQTTAASPPWSQILPAAARFALVMENGAAVLDKETGLVWQKDTDSTTRNWSDATSICYNLSLGGRKGWRLPSVEELSSLVDPAQSIPPALPVGHPFTNPYPSKYWSSTTDADNPYNAWYVNIYNGYVYYHDKSNDNYVWCVRGGQ